MFFVNSTIILRMNKYIQLVLHVMAQPPPAIFINTLHNNAFAQRKTHSQTYIHTDGWIFKPAHKQANNYKIVIFWWLSNKLEIDSSGWKMSATILLFWKMLPTQQRSFQSMLSCNYMALNKKKWSRLPYNAIDQTINQSEQLIILNICPDGQSYN